jgi:hypothetical protein
MKFNSINNLFVKSTNNILSNDYLRVLLLLITGVFMGYTLQPVPKWLNKMFDTSILLKFIVLFIAGSISLYPLNNNSLMWITVGSILTLGLFQYMRKIDDFIK